AGGGLPSHGGRPACWWSLTPPFHPYRQQISLPAVYFLWHCPAGHPGLPLATTLPCGARTFLGDLRRDRRGRLLNSSAAAVILSPPRVAGNRWPEPSGTGRIRSLLLAGH